MFPLKKLMFQMQSFPLTQEITKTIKFALFGMAVSTIGLEVSLGQEADDQSSGCKGGSSSFHLTSRLRTETLDVDRFSAIVKPTFRGKCGQVNYQLEADIRNSSHTRDKTFGTYREHTEFNLGRSYIEFEGSSFKLGVGNRGNYWGVLQGVVLVDLMSPVELEEYGTIDFTYTEVLQPQVYFDASLNDWFTVEGFIILEPKVNEFGLEQELTAVGFVETGLPDERNKAADYKSVSDTFEGGIKVKFKHDGWNSALIGFAGEQDTFFKATKHNDQNTDLQGFADERGMIAFNTFKQFSNLKLKAETAYWPEHVNIRPHHSGGLEFIDGEVWSTAIGIEHQIQNTSLSWQFFNIARWSDPGDYEESNQRVTLLVTQSFNEGRVRLLGFGAYEFETNHSWTNATLNYMISEYATLEIGVKTFSGPSFSFGGLIETDHVYLSTKFNF